MKIRLIGCGLALIAWSCFAHGPYDSSSELRLGEDLFEASSTLGTDAARQLLLKAGLTEAEIANALALRGPSTVFDLGLGLATNFFELVADGKALSASRLRVSTDGLEARFTISYAAAAPGELVVHARFYNLVEGIKPGAFTAMDENHNIKAQSAFYPGRSEMTLALQTNAVVAQPVVKTAPSHPPVAPAEIAAHEEPLRIPAGKSWLFVGVGVALAAVIAILARARRRSV